MIQSFRHKGLKRLFEGNDRRKLPADMVERLEELLTALDDASTIEMMALPSFRLHQLSGELKGFYAVTVRANWRVIFRFHDGDAYEIDFVDYH
jgi:proteic killer suppression protein